MTSWKILLPSAAIIGWMVTFAGCGLKTPPMPKTMQEATSSIGLQAHLVEGRLRASWWLAATNPTDSLQESAGRNALKYTTLIARQFPPGCPHCAPLKTMEWDIAPDDEKLRLEGLRAYYDFEIPPSPSLWRVQLVSRYSGGAKLASPVVELRAPANVPIHKIKSAWEKGDENAPYHTLRLFWEKRRERVVRVISAKSGQVERELHFRVNLYFRVDSAPWPLIPINTTPLEQSQWMVQPGKTFPVFPPGKVLQFSLRLVDQFGNQGPMAEPISVQTKDFTP